MDFVRNADWLNQNAQRAYPLAADATGKDATGSFRLPDDFLVGMSLAVSVGLAVDPAKFLVKSVGVFSHGFNLTVGYDQDGTVLPVASALIPRTGHTRNAAYRLGGLGLFRDVRGTVIIGQFDGIDLQPPGQWAFALAGSRLEVDAIHPMLGGVTGVTVESGGDTSPRLYGDLVLRAGRNMRITAIAEPGEDPVLIFDAIEGEGLSVPCTCAGDEPGQPVYSISGVQPDAAGNIDLLGTGGMDIQPVGPNGLRLDDLLSTPCCGCKELETVTDALEMLRQQQQTLTQFVDQLETAMTGFDSLVAASLFGDRACNSTEEA